MAKVIRLTPDMIEQCKSEIVALIQKTYEEINAKFSSNKMEGGKIDLSFGRYTRSFDNIKRDASIYFTETAWLKMTALIKEFSTEVAWHGIAHRDSDESLDNYYITDILVYPQKVTGGAVETDQEEYQTWLYSLDDEQFNNMRMQGHSHVNMATSPSVVDLAQQSSIIDQMREEDFYIFMIWNKSHSKNIKIYDMKKNILFETEDITIYVGDEVLGLEKFIEDAKKICKPPSSTVNSFKETAKASASDGTQENEPKKKGGKNNKSSKGNKGKKSSSLGVLPARTWGGRAYFNDEEDFYIDDDDEFYDRMMKDPFAYWDDTHYYGGRW